MGSAADSRKTQIAAMLNMFEYLDYHMGEPGTDLRTLVSEAEQYFASNPSQADGSKETMLRILKDAIDHVDVLGDLRLAMSDHGGAIEADAFFSDSKNQEAYVVYRGTGDGKWLDNGRGMTEELTKSQQAASTFCDRFVQNCGIDEDADLTVTGHSKGGNNAQAATLNADNRRYIDRCISFDGQGMSNAAVERYQRMPGYEEQRQKMYAVNGENDVVNELGNEVIPKENTTYIETNTGISDILETHMLEYLFHREDGSYGYTLNEETDQKSLGEYAHRLSALLMNMPEEIRAHCAMTLMQLLELSEEMKIGYDGDHASYADISGFIKIGIPTIIYSLVDTPEGREAMADILRDMLVSYEAENCAVKTVALVTASVLLIPVIFPVTVTITAVALAGVAFVMDICASLEALRAKMEELRGYVQQCMEMLQQYWNHAGDLIQHVVSGRPIIKNADFSVDTGSLYASASGLYDMQQSMQHAVDRLGQIRRTLPMQGVSASALKVYLAFSMSSVNQTSGAVSRLGQALEQTAGAYARYEKEIAAHAALYE